MKITLDRLSNERLQELLRYVGSSDNISQRVDSYSGHQRNQLKVEIIGMGRAESCRDVEKPFQYFSGIELSVQKGALTFIEFGELISNLYDFQEDKKCNTIEDITRIFREYNNRKDTENDR